MREILSYIWMLAPAGIANMTAPFMAIVWPKWKTPLDLGIKFRGKRLLGDHKTIRGMVCGVMMGGLFFWLQQNNWHQTMKNLEMVDFLTLPAYTGFLLGFGALFGDAVKSFFKRQSGIESGKSWFPWDQIDWILGMLLMLNLVTKLSFKQMGVFVVLGLLLHLLAKAIGFLIKINKSVI